MALFKIFKGSSTALGATSATQAANEGFAYFTPDDGKFYIDIANAATAVVGVNRIPLNAHQADYANTAAQAVHATSAEHAYTAIKADSAAYAATAGQAIHAASANYSQAALTSSYAVTALRALSAGSAGYAASAAQATHSASANYAQASLTASYSVTALRAISAGSAGYAASAANSTYAASAGYTQSALTAAYAVTALRAISAGSAGYAASAAQATHSASANWANLSGTANQATKVTQNASSTVNTSYRVLLSTSGVDTAEVGALNKSSNLQYNPSTNKLSMGNLQLTGTLNVSGQTVLSDNLEAQGITATDLLVNGAANFVQSPTAPTPADGDNSTKLATTAFVKGGFKPIQTTVDSGAATTNKWVSRIQQNANGVITVTMSSLDTNGTWSGKAAKLTDLTTADRGSSSDTWRYAWFSYNDNTTGRPAYDPSYAYQTSTQTLKAKHFLVEHVSSGGKEYRLTYGSTVDMSMMIGTGDVNHGLYDHIAGKWMIYADGSGNVTVNGNAATAAKLATARTINGTSFDGSANITTANWGTARNISISDSNGTNTGAAVSVNGSAAVTLKLPSSLNLAGTLDVTGNTSLHNETIIDSATIGNMVVTGGTSFSQIPTAPTAATGDNSTKLATTEFVRTSIAGLSGAMHFRGTTTTAISDGSTTNPITIGGSSYTASAGDVVLREISAGNIFEYVWTGSAWEMLGRDTSFKVQQTAVDTGSATTNKWVSRIQQDTNGDIVATMGTLDTSGTWSGNAASATALTSNAGGARNPIYFTGGKPAAGSVTFDTLNANRLMWTSAADKPHAEYHYANATKIAVNSSTEPTENFYVDGSAAITGNLQANSYNSGIRIKQVEAWRKTGPYDAGWTRVCALSSYHGYGIGTVYINGSWSSEEPTLAAFEISFSNNQYAHIKQTLGARKTTPDKVRLVYSGTGGKWYFDIHIPARSASSNTGSRYVTFVGRFTVSEIDETTNYVEDEPTTLTVTRDILITDDQPVFTLQDNDGTNSTTSTFTYQDQTLKLPATIKASLTGNASSATALKNGGRKTDANITHVANGGMTLFQATSSMTANKPGNDGYILHFNWDGNESNAWDAQLFIPDSESKSMQWRAHSNATAWQTGWNTLLDNKNYSDYTVTKTGTGASGTWGISITGNAATASKVNNNLIIKLKSGTTEGTDLYTFNGSAGKTLDIKQGTGITLTAAAGSLTIGHSNSVTAKTAAAQSAKTLTWGDTFTIYEEKYDAQGHVTGVASYNMTMPSNPNINTTYTFASGTTGDFIVTPSGGTAQTVSVGKPATAGTADALATSAGSKNKPVYFSEGKPTESAGFTVEYIVGTQTAATGSWTGVTKDSFLATGKTIAYKLPYAGSGQASLTLTFTNPTGDATSGKKAVYTNTSRVTNHYGAGSVIILTYDGTYWRASEYWNSNSRDAGYGKITPSQSTATAAITTTTAQVAAGTYNENLNVKAGNKWIQLAAENGSSNGNDSLTIAHSVSGATAGSYGDSSDQTPGYESTFKVPYVTVDEGGHVTAISEHTVQIPASDNTDTKNTAGSTDTSSKIYLIGATSQAANPQTYSDNEVFATSGVLTAKTFNSTSLTASQAVSTDASKNLVSTNLSVSDPTASGTGITYIATISQSAVGKITVTKSTVRDASATQSGVVSTGTQTFAGEKTFSGNVNLSGETEADSLTTGNLQVNGSATFVNTINGNVATASKVTQNASANTAADYRILLSTAAADTETQGALNKDTDLRWNPSTNTLDIAASNSNGIIKTTSGSITLNSASTIWLNKPNNASIIFTTGGADSSHVNGCFSSSGVFVLGDWNTTANSSTHKLYVQGTSAFTNSITLTDNSDASKSTINYSRVGYNYINIPTGGTFAVSVNGPIGPNIRFAVDNTSVHSYTTNSVTLGIGGTSARRWKALYIGTADSYGGVDTAPIYWNAGVPTAVANISLIGSDTNNKSVEVGNANGKVKLFASTNRGMYDSTNSKWIVYTSQAADHTYIPLWASKGSGTQPVYFNSSGEPVATTYALNATLNNATQYGVAYYSTTTNVTSTAAGAENTVLMGKGSAAPAFVSVSPSISITTGTSSAAPKVNVTVLGVSGTAQSITTASTSVYGVTKLNSATNSTSTTEAATPSAVKSAYDLANTANTTANNHKYWANVEATSSAQYDKEPVVKTVIVGNGSGATAPTKKVQLVYDASLEVLNFVFS